MLVQKLYRGQTLKMLLPDGGADITVTVLRELDGAWLVLGIDAPDGVKIERGARPQPSVRNDIPGMLDSSD